MLPNAYICVIMNKNALLAGLALALLLSCTMNNPLLEESTLPYGAPRFDEITNEHYLPAFKAAIKEGKQEIDRIIADSRTPDFANTIEAMERSGKTLDRVSGIFYNLLEANTDEQMQEIAEEVAPLLNEYSMYISLNDKLFERVKAVYERKDSLGLEKDQLRLLEKTYRSFVRQGALLNDEDKERFSSINEELSILSLRFGKNVLAATNAFTLNISDSAQLAGLPQYIIDQAAQNASERGVSGWTFDLTAPSYGPFMKYCNDRELRRTMSEAYNSRAFGGEFDNSQICRRIAELRLEMARLLGYGCYADYAVEDRMLKSTARVQQFLGELMVPSLPVARNEVSQVLHFAKENGFEDDRLEPWDFSYWAEKYRNACYSVSDDMLKPYFPLDSCINAVFGLASRLYGISFEQRNDLPVYHPDVKVFDVRDTDGRHLALFYCDFFPRTSKRGGAWMTEFRGQSIEDGIENRPLVSIVCNFSKPTGDEPALLTHGEFTTFLHEFGHALHGMLAEGRYGSLCGTNVDHDFVELPSQIMENWGFETEYLRSFAKHYKTGEPIPDELVQKLVDAQNYLSAYYQVRQLHFGTLDMAWHTITSPVEIETGTFEKESLAPYEVLPLRPESCISTAFSHIFSGGYSAGYYSYKWAEVLEADAFSLFKEKGIFNTEVSGAFRREILSKGSTEDEAEMFRRFRGHDPQTSALLKKLGIVQQGN